jgi:hypothetical protein
LRFLGFEAGFRAGARVGFGLTFLGFGTAG